MKTVLMYIPMLIARIVVAALLLVKDAVQIILGTAASLVAAIVAILTIIGIPVGLFIVGVAIIAAVAGVVIAVVNAVYGVLFAFVPDGKMKHRLFDNFNEKVKVELAKLRKRVEQGSNP